jgi:hypothetical protein
MLIYQNQAWGTAGKSEGALPVADAKYRRSKTSDQQLAVASKTRA